jgi:GDP-D-mannose 3',5'-epimerase
MRARAVVTGAGGFIGHYPVRYLKAQGYWVRGVDIKHPEYETSGADVFELLDLRDRAACPSATRGVDEVFSSPRTWEGSASSRPTEPTSPGTTF